MERSSQEFGVAHICPYCDNETGGADPCPWCSGSLGVVANTKITPVVIHERDPWDWRPIAVVGVLVAVVAIAVLKRQPAASNLAMPAEIAAHGERLVASRGPGVSLADAPPAPSSDNADTPIITESKPSTAAASGDNNTVDSDLADEDAFDQAADMAAPDQDQQDLPPSDLPFNELVGIPDAQVAIQGDGAGHGLAIGAVTIVNNGPYPIDSFQITLQTQEGSYPLMPFSGSFDNPTELTDRMIPVGGYLQVPVMSNGLFDVTDPNGATTVTVTANEGGAVVSNTYPVGG